MEQEILTTYDKFAENSGRNSPSNIYGKRRGYAKATVTR